MNPNSINFDDLFREIKISPEQDRYYTTLSWSFFFIFLALAFIISSQFILIPLSGVLAFVFTHFYTKITLKIKGKK